MKSYIQEFSNSLANFLAAPTKEEADLLIQPVINELTLFDKRLLQLENKIKRQYMTQNQKIADAFKLKEGTKQTVQNYNDCLSLMNQGYLIIQEARKQFTGQKIKYHTMVSLDNKNIKIVEFEGQDFLTNHITRLDSRVKDINQLTLRLERNKRSFMKKMALLDSNNKEIENSEKIDPSHQWDDTEVKLFYKLIKMRRDLNISPYSVTKGHLFETVDRISITRTRLHRQNYYWYKDSELHNMLLQRDNIESRKRGDTLDIQNKALNAQVTTFGQIKRWIQELIEVLKSYEDVNIFKQNLMDMFTSDKQISEDIIGSMEQQLNEDARYYIQSLFNQS